MSDSPTVGFRDDPFAPEVFAHSASGFSMVNGCITITFDSQRVDHATAPGPVSRVVVARLVLPIAGAQSLSAALDTFLESYGIGRTGNAPGGELIN